jgi:hypothetical protein
MTPEQEAEILQMVSVGMYPSQAAAHIGYSSQALSKKRDREVEFREAIEQAESKVEFILLTYVLRAAQTDYRAALAILSRRFPERWGSVENRKGLITIEPAAPDPRFD